MHIEREREREIIISNLEVEVVVAVPLEPEAKLLALHEQVVRHLLHNEALHYGGGHHQGLGHLVLHLRDTRVDRTQSKCLIAASCYVL